MSITERLNQDLKTALLSGDQRRTSVIRGLKSAILYAEVEQGVRETGLPENEVVAILRKEAKKRDESAGLYDQGGSPERAAQERSEKAIIEEYLPVPIAETELKKAVAEAVNSLGASSQKDMGRVIAAVKERFGGAVDGGTIAALVRERLEL